MTLETVTLKLPISLLRAAQVHAKAQGVSVGELVRQLLCKETTAFNQKLPKLQHLEKSKLESVFQDAANWDDLRHRLTCLNYSLRPVGTGLAIYTTSRGDHVCNAATVGFRYKTLVKRFGCPMPGHPHGMKWVAGDKVVKENENFDVIDRHP